MVKSVTDDWRMDVRRKVLQAATRAPSVETFNAAEEQWDRLEAGLSGEFCDCATARKFWTLDETMNAGRFEVATLPELAYALRLCGYETDQIEDTLMDYARRRSANPDPTTRYAVRLVNLDDDLFDVSTEAIQEIAQNTPSSGSPFSSFPTL